MGCFVILFALISPRLAIIATWLFSGVLGRAYDSAWLPVLGFVLLPWTTLTYAWMWEIGSSGVHGIEIAFVVLAGLVDLGAYGDGGRRART